MNKVYISSSKNPYHNLSIEEYFFDTNVNDTIFYLWQNDNTVVVGKHQNLLKEVNVSETKKNNVMLSRRTTGGGAVFHDLGNLNFSIIVPSAEKNIDKQTQIIIDSLTCFHIDSVRSGRNDILVNNRKFSGNAFRDSRKNHLHHGTLMVNTDIGKLNDYLTPSKMKFSTKGFNSVKSRVINLSELSSSISIETLSDCLRNSFRIIYGEYTTLNDSYFIESDELKQLKTKNSSYEWIYGNTPAYDMQIETKLSFGEISIILSVNKKGSIEAVDIYTDALNVSFFDELKETFIGLKLNESSIRHLFNVYREPEAKEIEEWLCDVFA